MKKSSRAKYYLLVTLLAFVISAILPFFAVYNLPATGEQSAKLSSVFGEKILICTAEGFKLVKVADVESGKEKPIPHPQFKCPVCYVSAHGIKNTAPVQIAQLNYQPTIQIVQFLPNHGFILKRNVFLNNNPTRAPPISIAS